MLNLDQVRLLENRVEHAVTRIQSLTAENSRLHSDISTLKNRIQELESLVNTFRNDQGRIEEGILNALERLSAFEDAIFTAPETAPPESVSATPVIDEAEKIEAEWDSTETETETDSQNPELNQDPDGQIGIF